VAVNETPKSDPANTAKLVEQFKLAGIAMLIDAGGATAKAEQVDPEATITYVVVKPDGTRGAQVQSLGGVKKQLKL
jgi:hypothetical protein